MIRRDAIHDAVTGLGIAPPSAAHVARILFVIQVEPFLEDRRGEMEETISVFVENAKMFSLRLVSFDELQASIEALKRLLDSLKLQYTVMKTEVNLSSHLDSVRHIFVRAFDWA